MSGSKPHKEHQTIPEIQFNDASMLQPSTSALLRGNFREILHIRSQQKPIQTLAPRRRPSNSISWTRNHIIKEQVLSGGGGGSSQFLRTFTCKYHVTSRFQQTRILQLRISFNFNPSCSFLRSAAVTSSPSPRSYFHAINSTPHLPSSQKCSHHPGRLQADT